MDSKKTKSQISKQSNSFPCLPRLPWESYRNAFKSKWLDLVTISRNINSEFLTTKVIKSIMIKEYVSKVMLTYN